MSGKRRARGVDQQTRFDARFLSEGAQRPFDSLCRERFDRFESARQFRQQLFQARFAPQVLLHRRFVESELVAEIGAPLAGEILERVEALTDQIDGSFEPRAPNTRANGARGSNEPSI